MTSGPRFRGFPDDYLAHPDAAERKVLAFWERAGVFAEQQRRRAGAKPFVFYEGPPTANGKPHSAHVLSRVFKDIYPRYKSMSGFQVPRKAGWDCHGLPVELEVEKELGISSKAEIEEYGIAEFNARCRESVFRYVEDWNRLTERIGFWIDLDDPYVTMTDDYIAYLERRAAGGAALVFTEASYVRADGKGRIRQMGVDEDDRIPGIARMADALHAHGALAGVELNHGGRTAQGAVSGFVPVAPTPIPCTARPSRASA